MKITIAGYGFVGKAHEVFLEAEHEVLVYDPPKGMNDFGTPEGVLICVATPQSEDGSCYMGHIYEVMELVSSEVPILIKSTISLEGWKKLKEKYPNHKLSFSPEFLRQKTAILDVVQATNVLIGGEGETFWQNVFVTCKPGLSVLHFTPEELILNKYFRNSFLATKVAFFNQIYDLCEKLDIDYENVRKALIMDERISDSHTLITNERGFGGHCFPKDTSAILKSASNVGSNLSILQEAVDYNKKIRKD